MKYGSGRRQRVRVQSLTSATPRFPPNRISNGVSAMDCEDLDYRFSESKACQARSGAVTWKSQKSCSRSTATPQCRPPRPLARTPALSRDAEAGAPPALPDDRGRSQIGTQGPEKVESGSLGLSSTGEAEAGLPARPAEARRSDSPATGSARARRFRRNPLTGLEFGRGFVSWPGPSEAALVPPGLAASRWMETAASVGAVAAAGA